MLADNNDLHKDFAELSSLFRATEARIQMLEGVAPNMKNSKSIAQPNFKHSGLVFA